MSTLVERFFEATKDSRKVVGDSHARYYGYEIGDDTLLPRGHPHLGKTRFDERLGRSGLHR